MQLVVLTFFIHLIVSFLCLSRCKKKLSFFLEILISVIMIANEFYKVRFVEVPESVYSYIIEYVFAKITILCIVIIMKVLVFYLAKSLANNGMFSKICFAISGKRHCCKIIANFRKIKYGPRLKLGVPGMAGKKHKKTGIWFDEFGFPKFKAYYTFKLKSRECKKDRDFHFYRASKTLYNDVMKNSKLRDKFTKKELQMFKEGKTPSKFTWHHHQKKGVMQLVDYKIHSDVNHIGGFSIWGKK